MRSKYSAVAGGEGGGGDVMEKEVNELMMTAGKRERKGINYGSNGVGIVTFLFLGGVEFLCLQIGVGS